MQLPFAHQAHQPTWTGRGLKVIVQCGALNHLSAEMLESLQGKQPNVQILCEP